MKLDGIHHVTAITADAVSNVRFYVDVLGLRLVKKSVNQDVPTIYHLFYADENGSAGSDLTFFEFPNAVRGTPGSGMVHTVSFRVASADALEFWESRLRAHNVTVAPGTASLGFLNPEGLTHELVIDSSSDEPLVARYPDVPSEFALRGFAGVRAYASDPSGSAALLSDTLGFSSLGEGEWESRGESRGSLLVYDRTSDVGREGAGSVHHVAWSSQMDDHVGWRVRVAEAGMNVTPVIDRYWFKSIYFREPSGVLFEIATLGPGFTVDEPVETLGEHLTLPPDFEHLRAELESQLTQLPDYAGWRHQ